MDIKSPSRLKDMRELVSNELEHIPRGNELQNEVRMIYQMLRMHSLGKKAKTKATKEEVLLRSIESVKKQHPKFLPQYDTEFFKVEI